MPRGNSFTINNAVRRATEPRHDRPLNDYKLLFSNHLPIYLNSHVIFLIQILRIPILYKYLKVS